MSSRQSAFIPNSYEFLGKKIFVAQKHESANDDNPGTEKDPYKTITAAIKNLEIGDHVYIDEGTYREEIPLTVNGHYFVSNSHIHFHAVEGKKVFIKASDHFDTHWEKCEANLYRAKLPETLFINGAYNPYEESLASDEKQKVRPCPENDELTETRGQLYVSGKAYHQCGSMQEAKSAARRFIVSADGKHILANFAENEVPDTSFIELTTRRRCFNPQFEGAVMIQTHGIAIEHAAEPGPFCKCRPESLLRNKESDSAVRKLFCITGIAGNGCTLMAGKPSYISTKNDIIVGSIIDDTKAVNYTKTEIMTSNSSDAGRTWDIDESSRIPFSQRSHFSYTLDPNSGYLFRHYQIFPYGSDPHGAFGQIRHHVMFDISKDEGKTWGKAELINDQKAYFLAILPLDDGTFIWPYATNTMPPDKTPHQKFNTLLGKWTGDSVTWEQGGDLDISPQQSAFGLSEPCIAQFPDGRLIAFFRQGSRPASQEHPGIASVKLFSISKDGGRSWSVAKPLTYDDGTYIYSPRAFHVAFRSIKNNQIYIAMNITDEPCFGCDPRTHLYLVEINPETYRTNRKKIIKIEESHPEHHPLVRFSNFAIIQDRISGNPILFMKLAASEYCPIVQGYDQNMYRYEVFLKK